jgi:hypothetical protein
LFNAKNALWRLFAGGSCSDRERASLLQMMSLAEDHAQPSEKSKIQQISCSKITRHLTRSANFEVLVRSWNCGWSRSPFGGKINNSEIGVQSGSPHLPVSTSSEDLRRIHI